MRGQFVLSWTSESVLRLRHVQPNVRQTRTTLARIGVRVPDHRIVGISRAGGPLVHPLLLVVHTVLDERVVVAAVVLVRRVVVVPDRRGTAGERRVEAQRHAVSYTHLRAHE